MAGPKWRHAQPGLPAFGGGRHDQTIKANSKRYIGRTDSPGYLSPAEVLCTSFSSEDSRPYRKCRTGHKPIPNKEGRVTRTSTDRDVGVHRIVQCKAWVQRPVTARA